MKLKAGRWYEDGDGKVHGPMEKLPKDDNRWATGMRFICGEPTWGMEKTWGKNGYYKYDRHSSPRDLIREVPVPSECRVVDARHPGGLVELPAADIETDKGMMARILDAARLTPVGLHTAPPADPMAELCQSIVTDAAEAAQAIRDKAVQDASEPASAAPPLVPKAIKRKKWGKWIKGPCMDWRAILQVEYGDAGQDIIRHRIKNPRE